MTRGAGQTPAGHSQSTRTIHSEKVATSNAAMPEGTIDSDQETVPLPSAQTRQPTTQAVIHWASVGFSRVTTRSLGYKTRPAVRHRKPANK
jgi:hypothetical protein